MNEILLKFAFRNIFLHKMKTIIVGSILIFGSFLAVLGNSIVDAISTGMKNSVTQSVTGDLQIYSKNANEKLSVFGNIDGSPSDVGYVTNFTKVKDALMKIDTIRAIIPMGSNFALMNPGNIIDVQVEKLRQLFKKDPLDTTAIENAKHQLLFLLHDLQKGVNENRAEIILNAKEEIDAARNQLSEVLLDSFWLDFDQNYERKIEIIANKIAPLLFDNNLFYFSYLGTDIEEFQKNFPQFEIVKGQSIPKGERGFLIHDYIYETMVKNRVARRLDSMKREMSEDKITIASSKELQDQVRANKEQLSELYYTLDLSKKENLTSQLSHLLKLKETDLRILLDHFFDLNDQNFLERYQFFYANIAPLIQLYKIEVGEIIPLTAMTKLGSSSALNVKVWGTFRFKSFENSPLAGNFSLIDLVSFRELYGFLTESRRKQNQEIEAEMGIINVGKDNIESLFGEESEDISPTTPPKETNETPTSNMLTANEKADVFINAAVFLKDSSRLSETIAKINEQSNIHSLGIQVADWQSASGIIGQMTNALRIILFTFVFVLFIIAALMIMNSLLMATMDRQQEIGTMRAIGAPKSFLYKVFLIETALTGLIFTSVGTGFALLVINTVGRSGIPARGDIAQFFFSGPKLYFNTHWNQILFVYAIILFISFLATQYPAWRAMKISPLKAMQNRS